MSWRDYDMNGDYLYDDIFDSDDDILAAHAAHILWGDSSDDDFDFSDLEDDHLEIFLPSDDEEPPCHIEHKESFNLLSALESVYPLSDIICQYLNYADLKNIGAISDLWLKSAEKEKLHRKQPSWTELSPEGFISSSENLKFAEKSQRLIFCDTTHGLRDYVDVVKDTTNYETENKQFMQHLNTDVPRLADAPLTLRKTFITVHLIESTDEASSDNVLYLSLYLPDIPNIMLRTFWFKSKISNKRIASQLDKSVGDSKSVECLLLFNRCDANRTTRGLLKNLLQLQSRVVFGGGIVDAINGFAGGSKVVSKSDLFCVAFMRKKNVEANFYSASFVLRDDDGDYEKHIKNMKETLEIRENTLIFRFGNNFDFLNPMAGKQSENRLLKETFPNAVVVGMNVNGEIGINSDSAAAAYESQNITHEYSTVLVYICWGKLLKSKKSE